MDHSTQAQRSIEVERQVSAPPEKLWGMVADVTRMGEWSPETTGAAWIGGSSQPAVGARFKGTNRNGGRSWKTECVVVGCVPGSSFSFDVKAGPFKVARWSYQFEPVEGGCRVVERWDDHRGAVISWISPLVSGTKDRTERNRQTMTETLSRLASAAERD